MKKSYLYAANGSNQNAATKRGGNETVLTREHYSDGRSVLSRRAKYLLMFLDGLIPASVLMHLKAEFGAENRRNQNMLAEMLFSHIADTYRGRCPEDARLEVKLRLMVRLVLDHVDSFRDEYDFIP